MPPFQSTFSSATYFQPSAYGSLCHVGRREIPLAGVYDRDTPNAPALNSGPTWMLQDTEPEYPPEATLGTGSTFAEIQSLIPDVKSFTQIRTIVRFVVSW